MQPSRLTLTEEIMSTFADRSLGDDDIAVWEDDTAEEAEIRDQLKLRSWRSVTDLEISQVPLCFLTDQALAILLPAVMLAVLRSNSKDFRVSEMLFDLKEGNVDRINNVVSILNPQEQMVVVKYLQLGCSEGEQDSCRAADYLARRG